MGLTIYVSGLNAWRQLSPLQLAGACSGGRLINVGGGSVGKFQVLCRCSSRFRADLHDTYIVAEADDRQPRVLGTCSTEDQERLEVYCFNQAAFSCAFLGNGAVAVASSTDINVFPGARLACEWLRNGQPGWDPRFSYKIPGSLSQLLSFNTGFIGLLRQGPTSTVYTWGDPRFAACLGREEGEATRPSPVPTLAGIPGEPVVQVYSSQSGYVLAARTNENDVYVWGCAPPPSNTNPSAGPEFPPLISLLLEADDFEWEKLEGLSGSEPARPQPPSSRITHRSSPYPITLIAPDSKAEKDIAAFGLGDYHAIALSTEGKVYVIGSNRNGQLGLGLLMGPGQGVEAWTEVEQFSGQRVVDVMAGPRYSLVVVSDDD